jgi:5-methylcytosine-specific restriction endonuclease McrA
VLSRRTPLQAKTQLRADPEKTRAWQQRSRAGSQLAAAGPKHATGRKHPKKARNVAPWRNEVFETYGAVCRSCGCTVHLQADHLIPRSQRGPSVVANGLVLCSEFGVGKCHPEKTAHRLLIQRSWLEPAQIAWLAREGHARWNEDGTVSGAHCRLFAPEPRR